MTHPALGNDAVGKVLHVRATPFQHCDFHAALEIEMHVQRRLRDVAMVMKISCEPLRQVARFVIVNIDQSRQAEFGSPNLHRCLLKPGAGEVADRL